MTLDWQVLIVAFVAVSLRFMAMSADLNVVEANDELHRQDRRSRDVYRPQTRARARTR
jgi:hypothetical protein